MSRLLRLVKKHLLPKEVKNVIDNVIDTVANTVKAPYESKNGVG